jgi:hypothetical protein
MLCPSDQLGTTLVLFPMECLETVPLGIGDTSRQSGFVLFLCEVSFRCWVYWVPVN